MFDSGSLKRASRCRNNGVTGKGEIFCNGEELNVRCYYRQLPQKITMSILKSESDHKMFYFWYGIFEVFEIF